MKKTLALITSLLVTSAAANAEICFLQIEGRIEMQGPCIFEPMGGGDFSAADADDRMAYVYFYVDHDESGTGSAAWSAHESHANYILHNLYRDGACWTSYEATLCAWDS